MRKSPKWPKSQLGEGKLVTPGKALTKGQVCLPGLAGKSTWGPVKRKWDPGRQEGTHPVMKGLETEGRHARQELGILETLGRV